MRKVFMFLIILFFGLCLPIFTFAEITEENPLPPDTLLPGMMESTGTHFEVNNSEYLNIVLESSKVIKVRLESVPEMITMHIESASEATSSQITISGFQPLTTYYKYEDDYHNEVAFATDENGGYSWTQDLSQPHLVFIQPRKSTKFIRDDATGGDCTSIGMWDSATKTCTLTTDVNETIQIDSDYITLDGNGHTVTGTGTGFGVYLPWRTGVTIKNLNVKNFFFGIYLAYSSYNTLTGNMASSNCHGIQLDYSSSNTLTDNYITSNKETGYGIWLAFSSSNTLISNSALNNFNGIVIGNSSYNTLTGNIVSNNLSGIYLLSYFYSCSNNTLNDNTISNNCYQGIFLFASSNNTFTGNNILDNSYYGILLDSSNNNQIYNNNFINNQWQAYDRNDSGNIFNLDKPIGGNYWSNFSEGCLDTDNDGFCDAPYYFTGGVDYLPWTRPIGLKVVPATIDINPDTLNKKSKSTKNAVTAYIEIPDYDINAIDINTVTLSTAKGSVPAQLSPIEIGDYDSDGIPDLMVKFERQAVIEIVDVGDNVEITINGKGINGKGGIIFIFKGSDKINVIEK